MRKLNRVSLSIDGNPPRDESSQHSSEAALDMLIKRGSDTNGNSEGQFLLHAACANGNLQMVRFLTSESAFVVLLDVNGKAAFDVARKGSSVKVKSYLEDHGKRSKPITGG